VPFARYYPRVTSGDKSVTKRPIGPESGADLQQLRLGSSWLISGSEGAAIDAALVAVLGLKAVGAGADSEKQPPLGNSAADPQVLSRFFDKIPREEIVKCVAEIC